MVATAYSYSYSFTYQINWRAIGLIAAVAVCVWVVCVIIRKR
jgi:hypothetical protein